MRSRLTRLWFALATLPLRLRFLFGRASFVEASVHMTTNSLAQSAETAGAPAQPRLLSHFDLDTGSPRTGLQGWRLFDDAASQGRRSAVLACGYCSHRYLIHVAASVDPLASELTGGRAPGAPASYSSDWFRFMHAGYDGPCDLYCGRCEQQGPPEVSFIPRAWAP
jgi:hypothetical protein